MEVEDGWREGWEGKRDFEFVDRGDEWLKGEGEGVI